MRSIGLGRSVPRTLVSGLIITRRFAAFIREGRVEAMAEQEVVSAGAADALAEGGVLVVEIAGIEVLVTRPDGTVYALDNECSHRGCNLSDGEVSANEIPCPCHGAIIDLRTGAVLDGPAPSAQRVYGVRETAGMLEVIAG